MNLNTSFLEIKDKLRNLLQVAQGELKKPYQMGQIMEEVKDWVETGLNFLDSNVVRTNDDKSLTESILDQKNRYWNTKERYSSIIENNPEYQSEKGKADAIETELKKLEEDIDRAKFLLEKGNQEMLSLKTKLEAYQQLRQEIEDVHQKNQETYEQHFLINEEISVQISNFDPKKSKENIENLSKEIKDKLDQFDSLLSAWIVDREPLAIYQLDFDLQDKISEIQK